MRFKDSLGYQPTQLANKKRTTCFIFCFQSRKYDALCQVSDLLQVQKIGVHLYQHFSFFFLLNCASRKNLKIQVVNLSREKVKRQENSQKENISNYIKQCQMVQKFSTRKYRKKGFIVQTIGNIPVTCLTFILI